MALTPGTRLGVYEVTAQIGVGGMGQVYRATDTTLGRQVAIKILPDAFAADPERLARFEREAKTLASLNHPHIAAIYAVEKSAPSTGSGQAVMHALVMELVEGDDLSQQIARGAIMVDEALPIAKQIAEALEAAHEQGIIHRDLKPANIKVRSDGTVKVLDFGLAKAMEPTGAMSASASMSPTLTTPAMTQAGMILGTAAYMSPEQAKGRTVDRRADVWAFGAVLYEMLTGQRAFAGEDVSDTLANVLKMEPAWERLPAEVPTRIRQVLRACLQKNAKQRIGDAQDVRLALEGAFETAAPQTTASATSAAAHGRLVWMAAFAVTAVLAATLAIPTLRHLRETPPPAPAETRVDIVTPATDRAADFSLSPDGQQIVFVASGDGPPRLWLRPLATTTAQPLAGTEGAQYPFWSPDARSIGFFAGGQLKRIDLAGGPPQALADAPAGRGGAWNPDGTILFATSLTSPLWRVSSRTGEPTVVTQLGPGHIGHRFPRFLPDRRHFLFWVYGSPDTQGIYLGSLDGGEPRRLMASETAGAWAPPGLLLFVRQRALVAVPFDAEQGAIRGEPVTVADAVGSGDGFGGFSVSAGLVAYRAGGAERRQLTWFARDGTRMGAAGGPDGSGLTWPELSPDGRRVAVARGGQGSRDVWLIDLVRGGTTRFTFDAAENGAPVWSPDGTRIVFPSARKGTLDLYVKASNGAGRGELLVESTSPKIPLSWLSNGRFLLFYEVGPKTNVDLWTKPLTGDGQPSPWLNTPFIETPGQFSPDGRWVAYQSNESGSFEIYVQPFPAASAKWQISTQGGTQPRWRTDGKELFFMTTESKLMAAAVTASDTTFEAAPPVALFQTRIVDPNPIAKHQYAVSRDGRFLINEPTEQSTTAPITLILNWKPRP